MSMDLWNCGCQWKRLFIQTKMRKIFHQISVCFGTWPIVMQTYLRFCSIKMCITYTMGKLYSNCDMTHESCDKSRRIKSSYCITKNGTNTQRHAVTHTYTHTNDSAPSSPKIILCFHLIVCTKDHVTYVKWSNRR